MTTERWRRIEDLYHAALELAAPAREGFLGQACGGDDDLRREVESLLVQNTEAIVLNDGLGGIAAAMLGPGRRFTPGSMLGPYRIVDRLGSGGMGEVYRATDTRLPRDVALKVLAAGSLADPERKRRFLSEARAIAALNHPHIVTFHDLLSEGDENVLVLEYVAGTTLDRILERRKPAMADALGYAIQTADALAAAHQAGIVHRDLKPANIIVSHGGAVKLLDFGLAKFTDMEVPSEPTPAATVDGGIVGTVAYMSPEQAEGRKIDLRSDIFSFGVVLLEMLTGRNAFRRDTSTSTLAAVIHDEPAPAEGLPAGLEALLGRCLRKDRAKRAQSMADIKVVLEEIRDAVGSEAAKPRRVLDRNSRWMRVLLALSVLALAGLWIIDRRGAGALERTVYMEVHPPSGATFAAISNGQFDISPDGSKLLFVAGPKGGRQQLWIQRLDNRQAESLAGTEEARFPFWSPDSRRLAFWAAGKLWRVEPGKGAAEPICDSSLPVWGGTWNRDDVIVFSENGKPLQRVPAAGGTPVAVLPLDRGRNEVEQRFPWFLPDGKHFLYTSMAEHPVKAIGSLSGESKLLQLEGTSSAQFVGPASRGYLIFQRGSKDNPSQPWYAATASLMAQAFDAEKVQKTGEPVVVEEPVAPGRSFSISENGVLVYRRSKPLQAQLVWIDRTGIRRGTVGDPFRPASGLALSPDGMIASARYSGDESDIWVTDAAHGGSSRFTFERGVNSFPAWSVDGNFMAWVFTREGKSILMRRHARGLGKEDALLSTDIKPESWSTDGRWIAGTRYGVGFLDVWLVPVDSAGGAHEPIPFVAKKVAGALYAQPQFSPDGRWIAYASNESGKTTESGKWQIYVQSVPEALSGSAVAAGKWQVSDAGGTTARWRADGKELFYLAGRRIMAVDIASSGAALSTSKPKELFETPFYPYDINLMAYAVTPDGRRFLVPTLAEGEDPGATPISVIVNWRLRDK